MRTVATSAVKLRIVMLTLFITTDVLSRLGNAKMIYTQRKE